MREGRREEGKEREKTPRKPLISICQFTNELGNFT